MVVSDIFGWFCFCLWCIFKAERRNEQSRNLVKFAGKRLPLWKPTRRIRLTSWASTCIPPRQENGLAWFSYLILYYFVVFAHPTFPLWLWIYFDAPWRCETTGLYQRHWQLHGAPPRPFSGLWLRDIDNLSEMSNAIWHHGKNLVSSTQNCSKTIAKS